MFFEIDCVFSFVHTRKCISFFTEGNIGCSRDSTFGDMVNSLTNGKGVDYVINCIPGGLRNVRFITYNNHIYLQRFRFLDNILRST